MEKIKQYLKLMRVKHYLKNFLVYIPLIFSGGIFDGFKFKTCTIGFIIFCIVASIIYIINDYRDVENDKLHKVKCNRPLASGKVSKIEAIMLAIILFIIAILLETFLIGIYNWKAMLVILAYIAINILYSFGLKDKPIVDIVILVSGFFLRVFYGALILNIEISNWLYLTVISAAFYMGLGKRRNEIKKQGTKSREVLKRYSKEFLDRNMYVCVTLCIVFYSLWTVDKNTIVKSDSNLLIWTVPLVMIILMKYSLNIEGDSYGDPVDVVLSDKVLLILGIIYFMMIMGIIYVF